MQKKGVHDMRKLKKPMNPLNFKRKEDLATVFGYMMWDCSTAACLANQNPCPGQSQTTTAFGEGNEGSGGSGCDVLGSGKNVCNGNSWTPPPSGPCQPGWFTNPPILPGPTYPCSASWNKDVIGDSSCTTAVGCWEGFNSSPDDLGGGARW